MSCQPQSQYKQQPHEKRDSIVSSKKQFASLIDLLTERDNDEDEDESEMEPPRKIVRFSPCQPSASTLPPSTTEEELKSLWYDKETISSIRQRELNKYMKSRRQQTQECCEQEDGNVRGLEKCSLERQLQRHRTVQCVLSGHKKGMTPEQTALMSMKCSVWNRDVAVLQACHDFFDAYGENQDGRMFRAPNRTNSCLPIMSNMVPPPFPFKLRRASCSSPTSKNDGSGDRLRVRKRTD